MYGEETSRLVGKFLDIPVLKENQEKYRDEREKVNMCTAIRDMVKSGEKRGEERSARLALLLAERNRIGDLKKASEDKKIPRQAVPGIRNIEIHHGTPPT